MRGAGRGEGKVRLEPRRFFRKCPPTPLTYSPPPSVFNFSGKWQVVWQEALPADWRRWRRWRKRRRGRGRHRFRANTAINSSWKLEEWGGGLCCWITLMLGKKKTRFFFLHWSCKYKRYNFFFWHES